MSLSLVDKNGRALESSSSDESYSLPAMRGGNTGWKESGQTGSGQIYGINRDLERRSARVAYFLNPMVKGITSLLTSYVVGDAFTYGTMDDKAAQETLEEMWALNNYDLFAERMWLEYLIDGESAVVFDADAPVNEPAHMALIDVDRAFDLKSDTIKGVTELNLKLNGRENIYQEGEFTWTANDALWNDPRGWPVMMQAIPSCLAYIGLINSRLRAQELLGRINGVYKALYYPGKADADAKFQAKVDRFSRVPKDGNVMALAMDASTGRSEEFDFAKSPNNASDAAEDARLLRMLAAVTLNIPPTWLGDAEDSNRASSAEMNGPPLIAMRRRQSVFRSINNRNGRNELVRRHGPEKRYTVYTYEVSKNDPLTRKRKRKSVTADLLEFPWVLPQISDASVEEIVKKVELMFKTGDASRITRQENLGLDPAVERERLAAEQGGTKRIVSRTPPKPEPDPTDNTDTQTPTEEDTNG